MTFQLGHTAVINGTHFLLGSSVSVGTTWKLRRSEEGGARSGVGGGTTGEFVFKTWGLQMKSTWMKMNRRRFSQLREICGYKLQPSFGVRYITSLVGGRKALFLNCSIWTQVYLSIYSSFLLKNAFYLYINVRGTGVWHCFLKFDSRFFPRHCLDVLKGRCKGES